MPAPDAIVADAATAEVDEPAPRRPSRVAEAPEAGDVAATAGPTAVDRPAPQGRPLAGIAEESRRRTRPGDARRRPPSESPGRRSRLGPNRPASAAEARPDPA